MFVSCRSRSRVMRPHAPSLFHHRKGAARCACDACVVSFFGQSVPEVPYARSSPAHPGTLALPFFARPTCPLLPWLARWTRPLARALSRPQCWRGRRCAVHEPAICGYESLIRRPLEYSTCPFLIPPALWLYRKTRCGCCWGETETAC